MRIPASVTGTVGVKTTRGRWPTDGIVPLSPTFDTAGTLTRARPMPPSCSKHRWRGGTASRASRGVGLAVAEPFFWEGPIPAWRSGWRRV